MSARRRPQSTLINGTGPGTYRPQRPAPITTHQDEYLMYNILYGVILHVLIDAITYIYIYIAT